MGIYTTCGNYVLITRVGYVLLMYLFGKVSGVFYCSTWRKAIAAGRGTRVLL